MLREILQQQPTLRRGRQAQEELAGNGCFLSHVEQDLLTFEHPRDAAYPTNPTMDNPQGVGGCVIVTVITATEGTRPILTTCVVGGVLRAMPGTMPASV